MDEAKSAAPPLVVTAALIAGEGKLLLARRRHGDQQGLCWEFPGGRLEAGESPEECLARELAEEVGVAVEVGPLRDAVRHRYPALDILLLLYSCRLTGGTPRPLDCHEVKWFTEAEIEALDLAPADRRLWARMKERGE